MNTIKGKKLRGLIVSHASRKTVIVRIDRYSKHPLYHKFIKRSKRYKAHDEKDEYQVGEKVIIQETRPISKDKRWIVVGKIEN